MQDHKTGFVQKSTSQVSWIYLEFGEIGNLATLTKRSTKRWGKIACSCARNYFPNLLKQVISSQAQQNKYKHRMMWLSAEMYRVWGGCSTRDAKNIRPDSICCIPHDHICWTHVFTFGWAVYGGLAQHFSPQSTVPMHWTSLLICCWMGGYMLGWPHEHCLRRLDIFYRQRPLMSHVPLNWCCVSRRFCCRRDPTIAGIQRSIALQAGWQPKLKQKVRWLGTSIWFCWNSRHNYITILLTFGYIHFVS